MKFDTAAALDVLTAGVAAMAAFMLIDMIVEALASEPPVPPGFVRLKVCTNIPGGVPEGIPEWALVLASSISSVGNPIGSPEGCVRISNISNRRLYVHGDEYSIAAQLSRALAQLPCVEGPIDDLPITPADPN